VSERHMRASLVLALHALAAPCAAGALLRPLMRPQPLRVHHGLRMDAAPKTDDEVFPIGPDGDVLITFDSLDKTGREMIDMALTARNKERILSGLPKYEGLDAMIEAYVEFEGRDKGMSRAECEDAVLRFLQRQALLSEGAADFKDPQTIVTFGLLIAIVAGIVGSLATGSSGPS